VRQTRMRDQALSPHAGRREALLEPEPEVEVGELRLAVRLPGSVAPLQMWVLGIDATAHVVSGARHRDDARGRRRGQHRQQVRCECVVPEVIDAELHLEPVDRPPLGNSHEAGVVDQHVDGRVLRGDRLGGPRDGGQRAQIELDDLE